MAEVSREQQEDLDPVLARAIQTYGAGAGDLIMAAYSLGRKHGVREHQTDE